MCFWTKVNKVVSRFESHPRASLRFCSRNRIWLCRIEMNARICVSHRCGCAASAISPGFIYVTVKPKHCRILAISASFIYSRCRPLWSEACGRIWNGDFAQRGKPRKCDKLFDRLLSSSGQFEQYLFKGKQLSKNNYEKLTATAPIETVIRFEFLHSHAIPCEKRTIGN